MCAASVTVLPRRTPPAILVVEDDVLARALVSDGLRARGFKVLEANSADDAIMMLDRVHVDLLLVDLHLPGGRNGLDVARHAQVHGMPMRIILTSGRAEADAIPDLDELGLFIRKPYLISHVLDLVCRSLSWPDAPTD
jgi:DNA-binding response OmpR family regulator